MLVHGLSLACRTSDAARGSDWFVSGRDRQRPSALRCPARLGASEANSCTPSFASWVVKSELWRAVPASSARSSALPAQLGIYCVGRARSWAPGASATAMDAHSRPRQG